MIKNKHYEGFKHFSNKNKLHGGLKYFGTQITKILSEFKIDFTKKGKQKIVFNPLIFVFACV